MIIVTVTICAIGVSPVSSYSYVLITKPTRCTNLKFIFGIELYMFRTVSLSIIKSLALYTQQQVYVIQVMLTAC